MSKKEAETKKQKLIQSLKSFADDKQRKMIEEAFGNVQKADKRLEGIIRRYESVYSTLSSKNLEKAEKIYKEKFINMGNMKAKRAFTTGEIRKYLNNKNKVGATLEKLRRVRNTLKKVISPCEKFLSFYRNICCVAKFVDKIDKSIEIQRNLKSVNSLRGYYNGLATDFSGIAKSMKSITDILPPGASDYCEFIFGVAQNGEKAAKIFNSHVIEITKHYNAYDSLHKAVGTIRITPLSGKEALFFGDTNRYMDIRNSKRK